MDELFINFNLVAWILFINWLYDNDFQGMYADKKRIKYKAKGDGFQADASCEDGICFQLYFRNDPENVDYTKTGISPFHSRVMTLFDSVEDYHHVCGMENLYNSVTFF